MKRVENRIVTVAMGIIVAIAIAFSQLFYFHHTPHQKKENKTEQHQEEEDSEDQVLISVPSTSLPSSVHVALNPKVFFLFEVLLEKEASEAPEFNFTIPVGQFFRTLFGVTISPNAP